MHGTVGQVRYVGFTCLRHRAVFRDVKMEVRVRVRQRDQTGMHVGGSEIMADRGECVGFGQTVMKS